MQGFQMGVVLGVRRGSSLQETLGEELTTPNV